MSRAPGLPAPALRDPQLDGIIKLAILAVGGQGGGVLTGWIEAVARAAGYAVQATSVAGVAQRTGGTIYYLEMAPAGSRPVGDGPVFALAPAAGDVDILVAAELMEAGRAIMRGFVTPDRTTLIASTHRALAVSEKMVPGDGIADAGEVLAAAEIAARRLVLFDMEAVASAQGSVISASLLGALAGSGALPFGRDAFEAAIRASGRGVEASLRAFGAACARASDGGGAQAGTNAQPSRPPAPAGIARPAPAADARPAAPPPAPPPASASGAATARPAGARPGGANAAGSPVPILRPAPAASSAAAVAGPAALLRGWTALEARLARLPAPARAMAEAGLRKVVDFQDIAYGNEYLDRVERVQKLDRAENGHELTREAAKHIANAMAYDDIIRVADRKTRAARLDRIRAEMGATEAQVMQLIEYTHPRAAEAVSLLPAGLGRRIEAQPRLMAWIDRRIGKGRRLRSDRLRDFVPLYFLGGLRRWRRRSLRHAMEVAHLERWLDTAMEQAARDYALGVEILRCRRLIKGYSDTHARGLSKFDQVMDMVALVAHREDAADWTRRLREAALKDEEGTALAGTIQTIRSFL